MSQIESTELFTAAEIGRLAEQYPRLFNVRGCIAVGERMWPEGSRGKRRAIVLNYVRKAHRQALERQAQQDARDAKWAEWWAEWRRHRRPARK
jgi:hypothetical protein